MSSVILYAPRRVDRNYPVQPAMSKFDEYRFHIDAYSPDTMPMSRLAEYLTALAELLGEAERVHFVALEPGSTTVVHRVEPEAAPKVRQRLSGARRGEPDSRKVVVLLNRMLRDDNAVGDLSVKDEDQESAQVIRFPGREQVMPEEIGPFNQHTELEGVLVRIGGKDETAHALLQAPEGRTWPCELTHEMARGMAHHLYGDPLRVTGTGRWRRDREGNWELVSLKVEAFAPLSGEALADAIKRLRAIEGNAWRDESDPLAAVQRLRDDDPEVH